MVPAVAFRLVQTMGGGSVTGAPVTSWPAAVYWIVFPIGALPGVGGTVMLNNWPATGGPSLCSHAATSSAANGTMTMSRASERAVSICDIGLLLKFRVGAGALVVGAPSCEGGIAQEDLRQLSLNEVKTG